MAALWTSDSPEDWQRALASYEKVIAQQGVERLPGLDRWYRNELPVTIASRQPSRVTLDELVRHTQWKMARGVWRARNPLWANVGGKAGARRSWALGQFKI